MLGGGCYAFAVCFDIGILIRLDLESSKYDVISRAVLPNENTLFII